MDLAFEQRLLRMLWREEEGEARSMKDLRALPAEERALEGECIQHARYVGTVGVDRFEFEVWKKAWLRRDRRGCRSLRCSRYRSGCRLEGRRRTLGDRDALLGDRLHPNGRGRSGGGFEADRTLNLLARDFWFAREFLTTAGAEKLEQLFKGRR